jgi:hypothetical protein
MCVREGWSGMFVVYARSWGSARGLRGSFWTRVAGHATNASVPRSPRLGLRRGRTGSRCSAYINVVSARPAGSRRMMAGGDQLTRDVGRPPLAVPASLPTFPHGPDFRGLSRCTAAIPAADVWLLMDAWEPPARACLLALPDTDDRVPTSNKEIVKSVEAASHVFPGTKSGCNVCRHSGHTHASLVRALTDERVLANRWVSRRTYRGRGIISRVDPVIRVDGKTSSRHAGRLGWANILARCGANSE